MSKRKKCTISFVMKSCEYLRIIKITMAGETNQFGWSEEHCRQWWMCIQWDGRYHLLSINYINQYIIYLISASLALIVIWYYFFFCNEWSPTAHLRLEGHRAMNIIFVKKLATTIKEKDRECGLWRSELVSNFVTHTQSLRLLQLLRMARVRITQSARNFGPNSQAEN